jgi:hypothetical protein
MQPLVSTAICVPFDTQTQYRALVNDTTAFRAHLLDLHARHPELFPPDFASFHFHSIRTRFHLDLPVRRVRIPATRRVFLIRPSFLMPRSIGLTCDFAYPLRLRQWAVPFDFIAQGFGRDPM